MEEKDFLQMSRDERERLVVEVRARRTNLLANSRKKRACGKERQASKKPKEIRFKSPLLEEIFYKMYTPEQRKIIRGK